MPLSAKYRAAQLAGSMRIEGFRVTAQQESDMAGVIEGRLDGKARIRAAILKHTVKPAATQVTTPPFSHPD